MIPLPPVRQLILPDPGFVLVEGDFERADAQFVAWYSNEPELKHLFQTGHDIYTEEALWVYETAKIIPEQRQRLKSGVHLTDYGGKARTLASTLGCTVKRAEEFQARWFGRFPGIKRWHRQTMQKLQLTRCIHNIWGFRRFYFDRIDEGLLPQALAWLGQSGTAVAINKAMLRVYHELPQIQLLLQIHDSILGQVKQDLAPAIFPAFINTMRIKVPFDDPLYIPVELKWSVLNWGSMVKWSPPKEIADAA
jgi:DNA polymerase I